jgi:hypothetical protein
VHVATVEASRACYDSEEAHMNDDELQRTREAVAQLAELRSTGNHADGRRLGEELLAQLGDRPPPEAQTMLCDALALTGDALYGEGRTEEADALWADLIGRFAAWSESAVTASVLWALDHRIAVAFNAERRDDAIGLVRQMMAVIDARRSLRYDAVEHVANVGYGLTGKQENHLALQLLAPLTRVAARETPKDRIELAVAITYRMLAASHIGDAAALQAAYDDLGEVPEELEHALDRTLDRVLAGNASRQVDSATILLAQKDFAQAMERPEKAREARQHFIDMFADSELEQMREAVQALIEQDSADEPTA